MPGGFLFLQNRYNFYMKTFSISSALAYGWRGVREHFWVLIGSTFVVMFVAGLFSNVVEEVPDEKIATKLLACLVAVAVGVVVAIGYIKIFLKIHDHENPKISELWNNYRFFWQFLIVRILWGLLVAFGLLLFVVPGIIWAIMYSPAHLFVIDKGLSSREAFRRSRELTRGVRLRLFGFGIVLFFINAAGFLFFIIGLLVTIPLTMLSVVHVYRLLLLQSSGSVDPTVK